MVASPDRFPESESLAVVKRRLGELALLEQDRDSYGAFPPSQVALDEALRFAYRVERHFWRRIRDRVQPSSISPLPSGGVELEWRVPGEFVAVDVGPDGRWGYLRKSGAGQSARSDERNHVPEHDLLLVVAEFLVPKLLEPRRT